MYRSATLAIVVSRTSMNVGMTTAMATSQGLTARRLTSAGARARLLMRRLLRQAGGRRREPRVLRAPPSRAAGALGEGGNRSRGVGDGGTLREWVKRLQDLPGMRPRGP